MECILKRSDYLELTETAGAATRATTDRVLAISTKFMATLNPAQLSIFAEIEELTSLETVEAQDGLARLVCGCPECLGGERIEHPFSVKKCRSPFLGSSEYRGLRPLEQKLHA